MTYTPPYAPPVTGCGQLGCLEPERARAIRKANADLTAEVARLRDLVRVSECANGALRTFWMDWAKKRLEISRTAYLRDAKLALAGDMRALENRVALMEAGPLQIVASDTE